MFKRLPSALFIVDITKEHIAVAEAKRLNIPTFAIVDTNSNPNFVDYAIPANDDASTSVAYIVELMCKAINEGLGERKMDKEAIAADEKEGKNSKEEAEELAEGLQVKGAKSDDEEGARKPAARKRTVAKK